MKYSLIYADPAWQYDNRANTKGQWGGAAAHYDLMTLDQICALPVPQLAARNCLLALWWVGPMPAEALRVVHAWGFRLINMNGFTWHKVTKHGKDAFGMGTWTRANAENCLLAKRGNPKCRDRGVRQIIHAPRGRHSEKPAIVRDLLVRLAGNVPRLELFARHRVRGWHAWGNEVRGSIKL